MPRSLEAPTLLPANTDPNHMHVLLAEDEKESRGIHSPRVARCGFSRWTWSTGEIESAGNWPRLRPMMPSCSMSSDAGGRDGLSVLRQLREVRGANAGPLCDRQGAGRPTGSKAWTRVRDDYLASKPFDMGELCARVRALTRRSGERQTVLRVGDLSLNLLTRHVERAGQKIELQAQGSKSCWNSSRAPRAAC